MATQNLTGVDALLQNVYRGPWVEQLNQETQMLDILEKTDANKLGAFSGRQLIFPVHSSRNRGRGAVTDGGQLATAGTQGTLDGIVSIKYFNTGIEVSDQAIKQSRSDEGSFVRVLTFEMDLALTDMRKDITRVAFGTGDGLLGSCTSTQGAVTTFAVDSGQFIAVGDTVDIVVRSSGATSTGAVGRTVTAVAYTGTANSASQANANITISGANISVDNTFGVYVSGDRANESDGLRNICNTGRTLHQINSSTAGNGFWDSNLKDFVQSNPSEDGIMQLAQQIRQRSGKTPDMGVLTLGGQRRLANTYASQKRWNDDSVTKPAGGYGGAIPVSAGGSPISMYADVDCPVGKGFLINKESFAWAQLGPPDWLSAPQGGGGILYLKDGAALGTKSRIWQAWMVWDATLVNVAPNRNGQFLNINDDVPVARL